MTMTDLVLPGLVLFVALLSLPLHRSNAEPLIALGRSMVLGPGLGYVYLTAVDVLSAPPCVFGIVLIFVSLVGAIVSFASWLVLQAWQSRLDPSGWAKLGQLDADVLSDRRPQFRQSSPNGSSAV